MAVGRNGGYGRLVNLDYCGVLTLSLIHADVVVGEMAVEEIHYLLLGYSFDACVLAHSHIPRATADE